MGMWVFAKAFEEESVIYLKTTVSHMMLPLIVSVKNSSATEPDVDAAFAPSQQPRSTVCLFCPRLRYGRRPHGVW